MTDRSGARRGVLPIPDRQHLGLVTYDAKDPDTTFPPIEPLLPPEGAPNVLVVLLDDVGFGAGSAVRWAGADAGRGTAAGRRADVQPVPHDGVVRADPRRAAQRPEPSLGRDGHDHRDRDLGAGVQWSAAEHQGDAGDDVEAERVLDRPVRQVSRGAAVADLAGRAVRRVADRRWRVRDTSTASSAARTTSTTRPCMTGPPRSSRRRRRSRGTTSPRISTDRAIDWVSTQKALAPGQAVLRVLRARRHARPASRAGGMGRQVRRQVRRWVGRAAGGDHRPAESARRVSRRTRI